MASKYRQVLCESAWMVGAAGTIASFLDASGIGEFIIHVIPILIAEGIPQVAPRHRTIPLHLRFRAATLTASCDCIMM